MNPLLLSGIFDLGKGLIDRLWPDPAQKAAAALELARMQQNGELAQLAAETDLAKLQIQTNIEEAKSTNWFVAGWRPGIGWVCGAERCLAHLGLENGSAAKDIRDLRDLLEAWRDARRTAWRTAIRVITTGVLAVLLVGTAIKLKIMGGGQ